MPLVVLVSVLSGCASTGPDTQTDTSNDPLEGFNRAMYRFNDVFDDVALKPAAKAYKAVTPRIARRGIGNVFSNLFEPINIINDLLQGKIKQMASDTARLFFNSTAGLGGLIDVATPMNFKQHDEDFGQTLAVWGVGSGPYIVLPIFGPSTVRGTIGLGADLMSNPITYIENDPHRRATWALYAIDTREELLGAKDILEQAAGDDPYTFVREAYYQKRTNLIYDGNPPVEDMDMLFEDDPPDSP